MTTKFTEKFKSKTDLDLSKYVENSDSYQDDAVLTAILELETRGLSNEQTQFLKKEIESKIKLEKKRKVLKQESKTPIDLPGSISNSSKVIYLSAALGIINPILVNSLTHIDNFSSSMNLITILVSTGILALFGYQINLGKKWARDIFTVLFGLGLLVFPFVILDTFRLNPIIGILSLAQATLQGYAILLLFKSSSRNWYKEQKNK